MGKLITRLQRIDKESIELMVDIVYSVEEFYQMLQLHAHIWLSMTKDILSSHKENNAAIVAIVSMAVEFLREIGLKELNF